MSVLSDEVLQILNEPDKEFEEEPTLGDLGINSIIEEEEVEFEFAS